MSEEQTGNKEDSAPKTSANAVPKNETFKIPQDELPVQNFIRWCKSHKRFSIPLLSVLVIIILGLVPYTRYKIAGLVIKRDITIKIIDATANTPVSGATVQSGSVKAQTEGNGEVTLHGVRVGQRTFSLSKKYYLNNKSVILVPFLKQKSVPTVKLSAIGRQVEINITNLITKQPLSNVQIKVADITAKTDADGNALIVLPASQDNAKTTLSLDGYNAGTFYTETSSTEIKQNNFTLTPAGKVYFLSKRTGTLNLMKSNLDGSDPQTVLEGTGTEEVGRSAISQSPDGKYVALVTQRNASDPAPQLYVLATADDNLLSADTGNVIFTMYGWSGDTLVYTAQRQGMPAWQAGNNRLKSYNAATGKIALLDQSSADGDNSASVGEYYTSAIVYGGNVIYAKSWSQSGDTTASVALLANRQNSLAMISIDGTNHKSLSNYPAADNVQYAQHSPNGLYVWDQDAQTNDKFYDYTFGSTGPKQITSINSSQFYQDSLSFYYSASGDQAAWNDSRDGQPALVVSDKAGTKQQVVDNSGFGLSGWFGEQYLFLTQNSSLFVIGLKGDNPIKITDFQPVSFY